MYGAAYQLMETGRHVHLAHYKVKGEDPPSDVENGDRKIKKSDVDGLITHIGSSQGAKKLGSLWIATAELGAKLAAKAAETAQTGAALVASAPTQILNPKLVLHIDRIVKGLEQSVNMVKDTGSLLGDIVA